MRLSDLIGARVYSADDVDLGEVIDVRLVLDGPTALPDGVPRPRLTGLVVGRRRARLIGYEPREYGPVLMRLARHWLHRGTRALPWSAVADHDRDHIRLSVDAADLPPIHDHTD